MKIYSKDIWISKRVRSPMDRTFEILQIWEYDRVKIAIRLFGFQLNIGFPKKYKKSR